MSAGRKPLKQPEADDSGATFDEQGFNYGIDGLRQDSKTADDLSVIYFEDAIRQIGHIEAFEFMKCVSDVAAAQVFDNIRKSGGYKGLPYKDDQGNVKRIQNLEELCAVKFGKTYRRMFDLSNNLLTLGSALYEKSERLGLRSIDYKALRSLPSDDLVLIKKALEETRSRDEVIGILQEMAAKHAKEKEAAAAEIEDLKGEVTAKENRLSVKSRLLDEAEEKVERFKALSPDKQLIELQNSATTAMREVLCELSGRFRHSLQNIADHCQNQDADESVFMSGLVKQIQHELIRVNDMFLLDGAIPNPPPEWMNNSRFDEVSAVVPDPSKH